MATTFLHSPILRRSEVKGTDTHTARFMLEERTKGRLGEMSGMTQVPPPADHQSSGFAWTPERKQDLACGPSCPQEAMLRQVWLYRLLSPITSEVHRGNQTTQFMLVGRA